MEGYIPIIKHIKVPDDDTADNLSRIPLINSDVTEIKITGGDLDQIYCVHKLYGNSFPLTHQTIDKYQPKHKQLVAKLKTHKLP